MDLISMYNKGIRKEQNILNAINSLPCPFCDEFKKDQDCGACPLKTPRGCSDNWYKHIKGLEDFITELTDKRDKLLKEREGANDN